MVLKRTITTILRLANNAYDTVGLRVQILAGRHTFYGYSK